MPSIGIILAKSTLVRRWRRHFAAIRVMAALLRRALRTALILPILPRALLRWIGRRRRIAWPASRRCGGSVAARTRRGRIARWHQRAWARIACALRPVMSLVCGEYRPCGIRWMRSLCPLARRRRLLRLAWLLLCLPELFIRECEFGPLSRRRRTAARCRHPRPRLLNGAFLCFGNAFLCHALGCFALLANAVAEIARGLARCHWRRLRYWRSRPRRRRGPIIRGFRMIR